MDQRNSSIVASTSKLFTVVVGRFDNEYDTLQLGVKSHLSKAPKR